MTLTDEIYLTKPQRPIPKDCPQFAAVRELTNNIGTTIMKSRFFNKQYQPLGIKFWSVSVAEGNRISVDSVERRINEISDARYYDTPLWVHLPFKYPDIDPMARCVREQSSYLPNAERPEWMGFADQIELARTGGITRL